MKFAALFIAAVAANQAEIKSLAALQGWDGGAPGGTPTDTRQADGPAPAPQRMSGVNGSVAIIPAT